MYAIKAVGLTTALSVWCAVLKMTQGVDWSWTEALAPFWPFALVMIAGLIGGGTFLILRMELTRAKMSRLGQELGLSAALGSFFVALMLLFFITRP